MRNAKAWLLMAALASAAMVEARDASACGGCFIAQSENTVVTGHKMILSISQQQTTLYDQIVYSGAPESFAWILPVSGLATIGLSSDALFQDLEQETNVAVYSPQITCPPPPDCGFDSAGAGGGSFGTTTSTTTTGTVNVVAQQTVGPYETVQLNSTDPNALSDWLTQHGYSVPSDIQPIITAYVNEGFDFLALKLVPGQGVNAMRPVRISTPGASPVLPLRMVAAGTGQITPITLWVLAEGRYDTANMPSFEISANALVWNWDTQSSNYSALRQDGFAATGNSGWLVQAAEPFSKYGITSNLTSIAQYNPQGSGYADDQGMGATEAVAADLTALFGSIAENDMWITRLNGELARPALAADLQLGAATNQNVVERNFQVQNTTGTQPACPVFSPCGPDDNGNGNGSNGWNFWGSGGAGGSASAGSTGSAGCAMTSGGGAPMLSGLALMAALAFARRRARRV